MTASPMRAALVCALLATSALSAPAFGQTGPAPYLNVDGNGVDLTDGSFKFSLLEGSIGAGPGEMQLISYEDGQSNWPSFYITQNKSGSTYTIVVRLGETFDKFAGTGTSLTSSYATGATLSFSPGGTYVYRYPDGTEIKFANLFLSAGPSNMCSTYTQTDCQVLASSISRGDGLTIDYTWTMNRNCEPIKGGNCTFARRLSKVANNAGYAIEFSFVGNSVPYRTNPPPNWFQRASARFINANAGTAPWPTVTYAYPSSTVRIVTTPGGKVWRMTSGSGGLVGIKRPGATSDTTTISYGAHGVSSVTRDGVTTSYDRTLSGSTATMVVTDALSNQTTIVSDMTKYRPIAITDPLGETTSYTYDGLGRLTEATAPEGNKIQYAYDARGNVTTATFKAKPGTGEADIVTTAGFDATCANVLTCNSPNWTKDAKAAQTDYTYDPATGQLLAVTLPAPTTGATRPQIRYGYTAVAGISMPTSVSQCRIGESCAGTADEVKTMIGYNTNALPASVSSGAGDGSLTATTALTYDPIGNLLTTDGPLAGTADTTTLRWSPDREQVGAISPDPDGGGFLKRRAVRTTYNGDGQATLVETGTVAGTTDIDWATFVSLEQANATYDADARLVKDALTASGATWRVRQYGYDALGRLDCTALRMNGAAWVSLPSSACTLGAAGSAGPDRIVKTSYDELGRVSKVQSAFGTADQSDDMTAAYSDNGMLLTLTDAEANRTTYEYDGHDRLAKTRMPLPAQGSNDSSATDYEQLLHDASGNVTTRRLRGYDGDPTQAIGYTYDALDRLTAKDLPGGEPDVAYTYDLLGRLTGASRPATPSPSPMTRSAAPSPRRARWGR
ncbi:RHS repeat protein [Sphingomonas gilva]|uniref:RHS repeat protein n=1 Tax=Sphingomonas gilva TaxID=2305907 RepID=A0A396RP15_9SPHN|nr:RHS repeat protein [Sphingomonas gilva]RHW18129.1 RHS repeat protein [Sphingomonas gilva]